MNVTPCNAGLQKRVTQDEVTTFPAEYPELHIPASRNAAFYEKLLAFLLNPAGDTNDPRGESAARRPRRRATERVGALGAGAPALEDGEPPEPEEGDDGGGDGGGEPDEPPDEPPAGPPADPPAEPPAEPPVEPPAAAARPVRPSAPRAARAARAVRQPVS